MAIDVQILTCPLCQTEHSAANAELVPAVHDGLIPERYLTICTKCKIPFYRKVEDASTEN